MLLVHLHKYNRLLVGKIYMYIDLLQYFSKIT